MHEIATRAPCRLEIRKGRGVRSNTVADSKHPQYGEEFNLIVSAHACTWDSCGCCWSAPCLAPTCDCFATLLGLV